MRPQVILPQDSGVGPPLSGSGPADRLSARSAAWQVAPGTAVVDSVHART